MPSRRPKHLRPAMLAVAGAAVLAAILIVVLSGGGGSSRHPGRPPSGPGATSVVRQAAGYLGLTPSQVRERLRSGESLAEVAASKPGGSRGALIAKLYDERAAAIRRSGLPAVRRQAALRKLRKELASVVDRRRKHRGVLGPAAAYLGTGEAALRAQLERGRTLAAVAASTPGRSRAGLVAALVGSKRHRLELAAARKEITAGEERQASALLQKRVEREVSKPLF